MARFLAFLLVRGAGSLLTLAWHYNKRAVSPWDVLRSHIDQRRRTAESEWRKIGRASGRERV